MKTGDIHGNHAQTSTKAVFRNFRTAAASAAAAGVRSSRELASSEPSISQSDLLAPGGGAQYEYHNLPCSAEWTSEGGKTAANRHWTQTSRSARGRAGMQPNTTNAATFLKTSFSSTSSRTMPNRASVTLYACIEAAWLRTLSAVST